MLLFGYFGYSWYNSSKEWKRKIAETKSHGLIAVRKATAEYEKLKKEYSESVTEYNNKLSKMSADCEQYNVQLKQYYTSLFEGKEKELLKEQAKQFQDFKDKTIAEANDEIAKAEENLQKVIDETDKKVGEIIKDLYEKSALPFYCACSPTDPILVPIDFSKENSFKCPKCDSIYKININAYPVLVSHAITNHKLTEAVENAFRKKNENE